MHRNQIICALGLLLQIRVISYREIKTESEIEIANAYSQKVIFQKTNTVYLLRKTYYLVQTVHFSVPYLLGTDVRCRERYHLSAPPPREKRAHKGAGTGNVGFKDT